MRRYKPRLRGLQNIAEPVVYFCFVMDSFEGWYCGFD